jgi:hypothetical protein
LRRRSSIVPLAAEPKQAAPHKQIQPDRQYR